MVGLGWSFEAIDARAGQYGHGVSELWAIASHTRTTTTDSDSLTAKVTPPNAFQKIER